MLHSGVVPVLLQLLQCALCGSRVLPPTPSGGLSPSKQKRDRERKEEGRPLAQGHSGTDKMQVAVVLDKFMVPSVYKFVSKIMV